jgi:hypothetical protein
MAAPGAEPVPLRIDEVMVKGNTYAGAMAEVGGAGVPVEAGWTVNLFVKDDRVPFDVVRVRVGDEVADLVTTEVPSRTDPRLRDAVVEVVDAATQRPVPGATAGRLAEDGPRTRSADARGRIEIEFTDATDVSGEVSRFRTHGAVVWACGYRSNGFDSMREGGLRGVDHDELAWFLRHGTWRIALGRADAPERLVRVLDNRGTPVADTLVFTAAAPTRDWLRARPWGPATDRLLFRKLARTDRDGVVRFPVPPGPVQVLVFHEGAPFFSFGLGKDASPGVARDLRLPAVAHAEIELADSKTKDSEWARDPVANVFGRARLDVEGYPPPEILDPEVAAAFKSGELVTLVRGISFESRQRDEGVLRLPIPVGHRTRLYAGSDGTAGGARVLDLEPAEPGAFRKTARWDELVVEPVPEAALDLIGREFERRGVPPESWK